MSPVLAVCAVVIRWSSPGPVLYRARRAGWQGREFTMYKLRTMHMTSDSDGRITSAADGRIFGAGRWMRQLKLDEVPQLVNVVRGEMAIVGPRPEDPSIVAERYTTFMLESLTVLPGLTSPGSLAYYDAEHELPSDPALAERKYFAELLPRKVATDMVYVRNRSWAYDLEVVVRTFAGIIGLSAPFERRRSWEEREAERLLAAATDGGGLT